MRSSLSEIWARNLGALGVGEMMNLRNRRFWLGIAVGSLIALSLTAEKSREYVGEEVSSKSGKFTIFDCFDMGTGTVSCAAKEGVKLYVNNLRSAHVGRVRLRATEAAMADALKAGVAASSAAKQAQKAGERAAKMATKEAKRVVGPIMSSMWDFFEAVYYEGTVTEGMLRGAGTLVGTYVGSFLGDERLGKLGYLAGSHLGSWVGGRVGLMVYDVVNGAVFMLQLVLTAEE